MGKQLSNLNPSNLSAIYACVCAHIICTELPPNLNLPIFLFRPLGTKLPNLKIANISGYTVLELQSCGHNVSLSILQALVLLIISVVYRIKCRAKDRSEPVTVST